MTREPDLYGPNSDGQHSYFRDLALIGEAMSADVASLQGLPQHGAAIVTAQPGPMAFRDHFMAWNEEAADRRLRWARDNGTQARAVGTGSLFAPAAGPPGFVAREFAIAARAVSTVARIFRVEPMPGPNELVSDGNGVLNVQAPRMATGGSVAAQAEQAAASNTDPVTNLATSPVSTVAGFVTLSQQLLDMSGGPNGAGSIDTAIAADLGAAWGVEVDRQLLSGTATANTTLGLLNVSGATSVVYTDATPTPAELLTVIGQCYSQVSTARGQTPAVAILHTRRWAWLAGALDAQGLPFAPPEPAETEDQTPGPGDPIGTIAPGLRVYATPVMPATLGAGTNEDRLIILCPRDLLAYIDGPRFRVAWQTSVTNLQAIGMTYGYLGSLPQRWPGGIGIISGSGLSAPVGY